MLCLEVRCHENSLRRVGVGHFYPRDATLARILAMARCQYVCLRLSVTSRCSIETAGRIELIIGMEASFDLSYIVL